MYDILLAMAEKDFIKFQFVYNSVMEHLEGFDQIHCVTPVPVPSKLRIEGVQYSLDEDAIDFDFSNCKGVIKERTNWYKQQFIDLFQVVTSDDYFQIDTDTCFNRKVNVIENGKPSFLFGKDQDHRPYRELTQKLFGFGREYPYSFISDMMFFKRDIIKELVAFTGLNKYGFFELIINEVNKTQQPSGFSEYDTYGNYVTKYFPDLYNYKHLKALRVSKRRIWRKEEVQRLIDTHKTNDLDVLAYHTYLT
jgi:hypothetical protein